MTNELQGQAIGHMEWHKYTLHVYTTFLPTYTVCNLALKLGNQINLDSHYENAGLAMNAQFSKHKSFTELSESTFGLVCTSSFQSSASSYTEYLCNGSQQFRVDSNRSVQLPYGLYCIILTVMT